MDFKDLTYLLSPGIPAVAIDFETYYDDECSVSGSSYWAYTHHPKFDPYMVAIYSKELGIEFVGHPKDFNWGTIAGYIWVAHNSPFDKAVYDSMVHHLKWMPPVQCHTWVNSADICRYRGVPGSLAKAMKILYGEKRSKQVRSDMKGKRFDDVDDDEKGRWLAYALDDAKDCYRIWDDFKAEWPRREMLLSTHTSLQIERGVYVDKPALEKDLQVLRDAVVNAERMIPWAGEVVRTKTGKIKTKKGQPVLKSPTSGIELKKFCRDNGIPVPKTTSVKEKAYQEWEALYGKQVPVVKYIQTWRRCNRLVRVIEDILGRIRDDGRMEFPMCYFGAGNTGRWSGRPGGYSIRGEDEKGINMQNLLKTSLFFDMSNVLIGEGDDEDAPPETDHIFNLRHRFIAAPGKKFIVADLAQIEPRVLAWLVQDTHFIERCKSVSPYQAHAEVSMGWAPVEGKLKEKNKAMYALAKARVLALGYGAGWKKFIDMASMYISANDFDQIFKSPITAEEENDFYDYLKFIATKMKKRADYLTFPNLDAETKQVWVNSWKQVKDFRKNNPKIEGIWKSLDATLKRIVAENKPEMFLKLPSGRRLRYHNFSAFDMSGEIVYGIRKKLYGGMLTENLVQGTARDVFGEGIIRLEQNGYPVIWTVHDEVIIEVDEDVNPDPACELFAQAPDWMPGLPVEAEADETPFYKK